MAWQNNKKIDLLFVVGDQNKNCWVHIAGVGWRFIWNQHDTQSETMMIMAAHAKNENRPVQYFEEGNKIKTLYVF